MLRLSDLSNIKSPITSPIVKKQKEKVKEKKVTKSVAQVSVLKRHGSRIPVQGEPGFKIPLSDYKILGQWCEVCKDEVAHALSLKVQKIRCLDCKTTNKLKQ